MIAEYPYHHEGVAEPTPGRVERLRARVLARAAACTTTHAVPIRIWIDGREHARDVGDEELVEAFRRLHGRLTGGAVLEGPWSDGRNAYNMDWFHDLAYLAGDDSGVLVSLHCFGAMPRDGVDVMVHLVLPDGATVDTARGCDYTQNVLEIGIAAPDAARLAEVARACDEILRPLGVSEGR